MSRGKGQRWSTTSLILFVGGLIGLIFALSVALSYSKTNRGVKSPSRKEAIEQEEKSRPKAPPVAAPVINKRDIKFTDHGVYEQIGGKTHHPSHGIFPKGCKWRPVTEEGKQGYEYVWWDFESKNWTSEKPAACVPNIHPQPGPPPPWNFANKTPRTEVNCSNDHCMYNNL